MEPNSGDRLEKLRASARGWHGVQLAVIGFIGLCGVLQGDSGRGSPRTLQIIAGILVLVALALACIATVLIASIAWPLDGSETAPRSRHAADEDVRRTSARLRTGVAVTFVAVGVLAVATASSWWPRKESPDLVEISTATRVLCGPLREGPEGTLLLDVGGLPVEVRLADVRRIRTVTQCP